MDTTARSTHTSAPKRRTLRGHGVGQMRAGIDRPCGIVARSTDGVGSHTKSLLRGGGQTQHKRPNTVRPHSSPRSDSLFRCKRPAVACHVAHNLRQVLCIRHDKHVSEHLEVCKVVRDALLLERLDKGMVRVQVGDDLETTLERDDLALQVALQDSEGCQLAGAGLVTNRSNSPLQADADLLVEDLEHLLGSAALEKVAVHLETFDGLLASDGRAQLHGRSRFRVVLARASLDHNNVLDLRC